MNFDRAVKTDETIRQTFDNLQIPFVQMTVEDIQERVNFTTDEIFKRWPDLKRGHVTDILMQINQS